MWRFTNIASRTLFLVAALHLGLCSAALAQATAPLGPGSGGPTTGGSSAPCSSFGTTAGTCAQGNDSRITGALQTSSLGAGVQTALGNATNATGGFATVPVLAPSYYLSGNWYLPVGPVSTSAGSATTANTIYCFYGSVTAKVTIKTLGLYLTTGILTDTLQLAIYSQSGGTLTLIDNTGNIAAGTSQSASAINGGLSNTTDVLNPGVLYAFCENSPGAMAFTALGASVLSGQMSLIGSATQSSINLPSGGGIEARSISQTYASGWPATITESSMSDVTTPLTPLISFQVN